MIFRILEGDCREVLATLPDESVQCCVTSPPYFGLRDYGVTGQLGLEKTPQEYVDTMVQVFAQARRVLRNDGTLWLNIGDSYAASGRGGGGNSLQNNAMGREISEKNGFRSPPPGYKQKDLIGIPWMLAFALRADGWYLRDEIIWHKPNPMPSSVLDRTTRAHEQIFLLSKSRRYYYDHIAIRTEAKGPTTKMPDGWDPGPGAHGTIHRTGREKGKKALPETQAKLGKLRDKQRGHSRQHAGFNGRWDAMPRNKQQSMGANARSVWTIATHGFPEAHFATFPPKLIEPCILAGCPRGGAVLDPFSGAGTTGLVCSRLGRDYIGIELNPEYAAMSRKRITADAPLFEEGEA